MHMFAILHFKDCDFYKVASGEQEISYYLKTFQQLTKNCNFYLVNKASWQLFLSGEHPPT